MVIVIFTMLCVTLSLLPQTLYATSIYAHQRQLAFHELATDYQLDHPALPRKLLVKKQVEDYEAKDLVSSNEQNIAYSGEPQKGEEVKLIVHAAKGTRQEWVEGSDPTLEFFTMDYSHVRRRRPIHNKSFPKTLTNSP